MSNSRNSSSSNRQTNGTKQMNLDSGSPRLRCIETLVVIFLFTLVFQCKVLEYYHNRIDLKRIRSKFCDVYVHFSPVTSLTVNFWWLNFMLRLYYFPIIAFKIGVTTYDNRTIYLLCEMRVCILFFSSLLFRFSWEYDRVTLPFLCYFTRSYFFSFCRC